MFSTTVVMAMVMSVVVATHNPGFLAPSGPGSSKLALYYFNGDNQHSVGQINTYPYGGPTLCRFLPYDAFYVALEQGADRYIVKYDTRKEVINMTYTAYNSVAGFAIDCNGAGETNDDDNDIFFLGFEKGITLHRMHQDGIAISTTDFSEAYPDISIQIFGAPFKNGFYDTTFYLCLTKWEDTIYNGLGSLSLNGTLTSVFRNGNGVSCYGDTLVDPTSNSVFFQGYYDSVNAGPSNFSYDLYGIATTDLSLQQKEEFIFTSMMYNGLNYTNWVNYGYVQGHIDIDPVGKRIYAVLAPLPYTGSPDSTILVSMTYDGYDIQVLYENPPFYLGDFSVVWYDVDK